MIYYLCPTESEVASGGQRRLYHHVDLLNELGFEAAVLHRRGARRLGWFPNQTPITFAPLDVNGEDILVIPEYYRDSSYLIAPGIPRVLLNLSIFHTSGGLADIEQARTSPGRVLGVLCNSQYGKSVLDLLLPGLPVHHVPHSIDRAVWFPDASSRSRRIAFMPRKQAASDATLIFQLLKAVGALDGWDVVAIDGKSEPEVAEMLRSATIFLSLSAREGFGRPPAEAVACGCTVIGYSGVGGKEVFRYPSTIATPDGDILALALELVSLLEDFEIRESELNDAARTSATRIVEDYGPESERAALEHAFEQLASRDIPQIRGVITSNDLRRRRRWPRSVADGRHILHRLRRYGNHSVTG